MKMPHDWKTSEIAWLISGVAIFYGFLAVCVLLLFIVSFPYKANALECKGEPGSGSYWSWRLIDGRKCWFHGRRVMPKSALHWTEEKPAPPKHVDPPPPDAPKQSILFPNLNQSDQHIAKELLVRAPMTAWPLMLDIDAMQSQASAPEESNPDEFNDIDAAADNVPPFETRWRDVPVNKSDKLIGR